MRRKGASAAEPTGGFVLSKRRILLVGGGFILLVLYIVFGVSKLMLVDADEILKNADKRHYSMQQKHGRRGMIIDRNGNILAANQDTKNIIANPMRLKSDEVAGGIQGIAREIARNLDLPYEEVYDKIATSKSFVRLLRNVDSGDELVENIKKLGKKPGYRNGGVDLEPWSKRIYPQGSSAAHLTGYADFDNVGKVGLESYFDEQLTGKSQARRVQKLAGGHAASEDTKEVNLDGDTIQLSIDTRIQSKAATALEVAVMVNSAVSGSIVVMDVHSGEILALANAPTYDPNEYGKADIVAMRNHAVADFFEPGSVFKTFSTVAYLKKYPHVQMTDVLIPEPNPIFLDRTKTLKEHGLKHPNLTAADILAYSSNIGAATMALDVGDVAYYQVLRDFGFGEKTGVEFSGEAVGLLADPRQKSWKRTQLATIAFGQSVTVTTVQLAAAYAAIANDGYYNPPTIIKGAKKEGRQVISQELAKKLQFGLSQVLVYGTGRRAKPASYTAAGKTGTAQKVEGGRYSEDNYMATFAGFAPLENPQVAIVVNIDSPQPHHEGGTVSAPVFAQVMEEALQTLMVKPSAPRTEEKKAEKSKKLQSAAQTMVVLDHGEEKEVTVAGTLPNLAGKSITEALLIIKKKSKYYIPVAIHGSGYVVEQNPPLGTPLKEVKGITLECSPDK